MKLVTSSPEVTIATATKPLIDALLALNTNNRKLRHTAVSRLAQDIASGHWKLTASGVGVDSLGRLCDGQHRLQAIVEAGYPPIQFMLATGLDPDSQAVVDRHAKRSMADALSLVHGRTISTNLVAAANCLISIKNATSKTDNFAWAGSRISDAQAAATMIEWEDDLTPVMAACGGSARAPVAAALAVYHRHDAEGAIELSDQLRRGIGLSEFDPAYRLRSALNIAACKAGGSQSTIRAFSYTVTAIVAHAEGRSLKLLKLSDSWTNAPWKVWKA
jgi:hypothetical protein